MLTLQSKYLKKFARNSKNALNKIHSSDDPLKELGPGISSYHQLLVMLFGLFVVLTLIHIPLYNSYYNYGYFEGGDFDFLTQLSLGNLGYSKTECSMESMIEGNQK